MKKFDERKTATTSWKLIWSVRIYSPLKTLPREKLCRWNQFFPQTFRRIKNCRFELYPPPKVAKDWKNFIDELISSSKLSWRVRICQLRYFCSRLLSLLKTFSTTRSFRTANYFFPTNWKVFVVNSSKLSRLDICPIIFRNFCYQWKLLRRVENLFVPHEIILPGKTLSTGYFICTNFILVWKVLLQVETATTD